ncbi:MAG: alpha/beta fold hydrolase, partial [Candidatus Binatia bacterium]
MPDQVTKYPNRSLAARFSVPGWLAVLSGVLGSALGIATNLYSAEFRDALEQSTSEFNPAVMSIIVAAIVSSTATTIIYRTISRRRQLSAITPGEIKIHSDAVSDGMREEDAVVGRTLKFLEAKRSSDDLLVFLHGLGLDANDFRPYMAESKFHCIALTMYGFNTEESNDQDYHPISLESHISVVTYGLEKLRQRNPRKRLSLVGFSFGADMVLFLAMLASPRARELPIAKVVLLDPNLNCETLTVSREVAKVDLDRPLAQLDRILESVSTISDFRDYCEYLYKITGKSFVQVRRYAGDVVNMWTSPLYNDFLD